MPVSEVVNLNEVVREYLTSPEFQRMKFFHPLVTITTRLDPGIGGLSTYEQILRLNPRQRAIIASGFAEFDRVKMTQKLGAGAYLRKPYTVEALARTVKSELAPRGEMAG